MHLKYFEHFCLEWSRKVLRRAVHFARGESVAGGRGDLPQVWALHGLFVILRPSSAENNAQAASKPGVKSEKLH